MCRTLFMSITRDEHRFVSWVGQIKKEQMRWPEIWKGSDAPEGSWSLSPQKPRPTQEGLGCRLIGTTRIRLFLRLLGLPNARGNSTSVLHPTFRNSTTPGHFTMVMAEWTLIFPGTGLPATRLSTPRWARYRMDW